MNSGRQRAGDCQEYFFKINFVFKLYKKIVTKLGQLKKNGIIRYISAFEIVATSLLQFVEFENENNFFKHSQLSPALCGSEFIDHSILPKKLKSLDFFKKKKMQFFPGSFSIFQPFKWSQTLLPLFVEFENKSYIFKNIPSVPPPFTVRNSSTNNFYQIN